MTGAEGKLEEAKNLRAEKKFEESIEAGEEALKLAIISLGNDMDYRMAKYYYFYSDLILSKVNTSLPTSK
jgi:hypothetical protein